MFRVVIFLHLHLLVCWHSRDQNRGTCELVWVKLVSPAGRSIYSLVRNGSSNGQ